MDYPWCKEVVVILKAGDGQEIGHCQGVIIDRERIRSNFYAEVEGPSYEIKEFGINLFDRWGNLKSEYYKHPIKKGTGAWAKELDQGKILLINSVYVNKLYRRRGYGKQLVRDIWQKASKKSPDCRFAAAMIAPLLTDIQSEFPRSPFDTRPPSPEEIARCDELHKAAEKFWREVGFRCIGTSLYGGFAVNEHHPSKAIAPSDDYHRPLALRGSRKDKEQQWPYNKVMTKASDEALLEILKRRVEENGLDDPRWQATDNYSNNILHFVALGKPKSLSFLSKLKRAEHLERARNLIGETPLDLILASLERRRSLQEDDLYDVVTNGSDDFTGHPAADLSCLLTLMNLQNPPET